MDLAETLLTATPRPMAEALIERSTGIYAWWGTANVPWPAGFPTVNPERPLYVGKAQNESIGDRARFHLGSTRGSAPRRSLTGLLLGVLPLRGHVVVRDPKRRKKYGLDATGSPYVSPMRRLRSAAADSALQAA